METIAYTSAVLTGFMISQTYNYFFTGSATGKGPLTSNESDVHTNINIHTHHHTSSIEMERSQCEKEIHSKDNVKPTISIPQSLLYDIEVFSNDELKPINIKKLPMNLTLEDELKARLSTIRKYVENVN